MFNEGVSPKHILKAKKPHFVFHVVDMEALKWTFIWRVIFLTQTVKHMTCHLSKNNHSWQMIHSQEFEWEIEDTRSLKLTGAPNTMLGCMKLSKDCWFGYWQKYKNHAERSIDRTISGIVLMLTSKAADHMKVCVFTTFWLIVCIFCSFEICVHKKTSCHHKENFSANVYFTKRAFKMQQFFIVLGTTIMLILIRKWIFQFPTPEEK